MDQIYDINTPTLKDYIEVVQYFLNLDMTWLRGETCIFPEYWWGNRCCVQIYTNNKITCWSKLFALSLHDRNIITIDEFYRKFPGVVSKRVLKEFK